MGLFPNSKRLESSDGSAQDQSMDVMSACEKQNIVLLIHPLTVIHYLCFKPILTSAGQIYSFHLKCPYYAFSDITFHAVCM